MIITIISFMFSICIVDIITDIMRSFHSPFNLLSLQLFSGSCLDVKVLQCFLCNFRFS